MLPSFRLIAATFLFGFVVVCAGLRLAASLNDIHEGLPVMAAHAAPAAITPVADAEFRRSAAVPVIYDLRFAVVPAEAAAEGTPAPAEAAAEPVQPTATVAAIPLEPLPTEAPPPTPMKAAVDPMPTASIEPTPAETPPSVAKVKSAPQATTDDEPKRRVHKRARAKPEPEPAKPAARDAKAAPKKPIRLAHRAAAPNPPAASTPAPAAVTFNYGTHDPIRPQ